MPSGAKRRKAAKKKKEQLSNNSNNHSSSINNTNPQGNDDLKSQDEKESDGGELGSPSSQDLHNQEHQFNEENEESEKRDQSSFASEYKPFDGVTSDAQGSQNVGVEDDSVIKIEMQLNAEQDFESKDISVEHVESAKESNDGEDKSSTSSSSDNESHNSDTKLKEEVHNSALDGALQVFPEKVSRESGIEKPIKEANGNSVVGIETANDFATPQTPMSEVAKCVTEGAEVVNQKILDAIEPGLKEVEDKSLLKSNDAIAGLVPEKNGDKAFPTLDEKVGASLTMVTSDANGNDGKLLASSGIHTSEATNDALKTRDIETSEYIETQPLVSSAPQVTQGTSWLSCCGLFDIFAGSTR